MDINIISIIESLITERAKNLAIGDTIKEFQVLPKEVILKAVALGFPVIDGNRIIARETVKDYYDKRFNNYRAKIENELYLKLEHLIGNILNEK